MRLQAAAFDPHPNEIAEWGPSDHCRIVIDVASMHRPSNLTPGADPLAKLQGGIRNRSVR
jgi:hypothetical protein